MAIRAKQAAKRALCTILLPKEPPQETHANTVTMSNLIQCIVLNNQPKSAV